MADVNWRNNTIKLIAVLLALVLWVYVSSEQNPVREKLITVNLQHNDLSRDFVITGGMPESVRLRVQGNQNQLANITADQFKATVDIPEGTTGNLTLPVQVNAPAGLRVAQTNPDQVQVTVDRIVERQVSVAVSLRGATAQGYTALAPVFQPESVVVKGPSTVVNQVNQVTGVVDIQSANRDVEQIVTLSTGTPNVSLSPTVLRVVVPVVSTVTSKTVAVLPGTTGSPAEGFTVKRSSAEPAFVQISGTAEVLNHINSVRTEPVDITGANKNITRDADLVTPQGVTGIQPERVKVHVEVSKVEAPPQPPEGSGGETEL